MRPGPMPLPDDETAALPSRRPRWSCHLVAAGFVTLDVAIFLATREWTSSLDLAAAQWLLEDSLTLLGSALPGILLLPAYRRVSFRRRDVLFFALLPLWGFVIAWKVGFRLTSLPYRDWSPRLEEYPRTRWVPGSAFHVVPPPPRD
ncbi:MAG TPA: hypothetical protein VLB29_06370 [Nocardioidaceae bacterium]|nr:hypothetical protein [Nocardioidaceae bacterium]